MDAAAHPGMGGGGRFCPGAGEKGPDPLLLVGCGAQDQGETNAARSLHHTSCMNT